MVFWVSGVAASQIWSRAWYGRMSPGANMRPTLTRTGVAAFPSPPTWNIFLVGSGFIKKSTRGQFVPRPSLVFCLVTWTPRMGYALQRFQSLGAAMFPPHHMCSGIPRHTLSYTPPTGYASRKFFILKAAVLPGLRVGSRVSFAPEIMRSACYFAGRGDASTHLLLAPP